MVEVLHQFQIFTKPVGSICNLECDYCYYLEKKLIYPKDDSFTMPDDILEEYILQHINASPDPVINFSWHGGEPTLLGLDYFRKIVALQRKHKPSNRRISNGIQTNGTIINDEWCRFFAEEGFTIGLSLDGPQDIHDRYRVGKDRKPTHEKVMRGFELLRKHRIPCDILCVVNAHNVQHPTRVYRFFKEIKAQYIGFIPLVEPQSSSVGGVSERTVPAEDLGIFLCTIFDEWKSQDIGRVIVQIFEETARTALGYDHALCIFRKTCGDIPVIEHNGDFFSCDHFVNAENRLGNIMETPLVEMLESPEQIDFGQVKSDKLPRYCRECEVLNMCHGGCPKDRLIKTPDGEKGLNYLCAGYKRFFTHCGPFLKALASLWQQEPVQKQPHIANAAGSKANPKPGRNDPCPCGSGRKYKKCCLNK